MVNTGEPEPPLGLHPSPHPVTGPLLEGTRLLFYTDGLVETRNRDGAFFPLADSAAALRTGHVGAALDTLLGRLVDHAGEQINDDMALVLVEHQSTRTGTD
jgi:serine phosphatase RsbU (regulator of sigma subunit)